MPHDVDPGTSIRLHKLVRAPRARVFQALTTGEQIVQWWLPQEEGDHTVSIDPRVGGAFRVTMREQGQLWEGVGTITAFDPPTRFAYTWTWTNDPAFGGDSHVTFELRDAPNPFDDGPATEVVLTHTNLLTAHVRSDFTGGWWDGLRALGYFVRGVDPREAIRPRK